MARELLNIDTHRLHRGQTTGEWLWVASSTANSMEFGENEWREVICLIYGIEPKELPQNWDTHGAWLSIPHALYFKKGVLVTPHHSELQYGVAYLDRYGLMPIHVRDRTLINNVATCKAGVPQQIGHPNPTNNQRRQWTPITRDKF